MGRLLVHRFDKRHPNRGETLLEQALFAFVQIALGFDFQHLQLVDEHPGGLHVADALAGFRMGRLAQKDHGHVRLLQHHVGEQGGRDFFPAGMGQRILGRIGSIHGL